MAIKNKTTLYYACFLIVALFPQIFGFNGTIYDTIWKIAAVFCLIYATMIGKSGFKISMSGFAYCILYLFANCVINLVSTFSGSVVSINTFINIFMSVILIYAFFECPKREEQLNEKEFLIFYKIIVWFMIIACIYNMIINFNLLFELGSISVYDEETANSFFDNKNTFGVFLMFGTLAAITLKVHTKNVVWLLCSLLFILNEIMAMCRTAIVLSLVLFVSSFMIENIKKKSRALSAMALLGIVVGIIAIIFAIPAVNNFIFDTLFGNTDSLDARQRYIEQMLPLIDAEHFLTGYGDDASTQLAIDYAGNQYYHNTYLYLMISGGIVKLSLLAVIIFIALSNAFKVMKTNTKNGLMCLVTIFIYLVYAWIESIVIFNTPVISMMATIFVVSMPILYAKTEIS